MWLVGYWTMLLLLGVVGAVQSSSISSNCTSVNIKPVSLQKFLQGSPYYLLETSSDTDLGIDVSTIDTVCFTVYSSGDCCTAYVQAVTTLDDCSTVITTTTLTEIEPGNYLEIASDFEYEDLIFGVPCRGTYVMYLCSQDGSDSYEDTVIILSTQRSVDEDCLQRAECLALRSFPNITFNKLPNTVPNPYFCNGGCSE